MSGAMFIIRRLAKLVIFKLLRLVFTAFQRLLWELNGTSARLRDARRPENYGRSAQVLDVRMRYKFCPSLGLHFEDFICTHYRFVSPQYIIDNDHITLMTITDEYAIFCEAEKGMHLWRSDCSAFLWAAQMEHCKRLIRVPLVAFHRMSEFIGDPKAQVIFVFSTGRCGSTLLTQVMESTGRCVSVSEPLSVEKFLGRYATERDSPALRQLTRDVIRWDCRPYSTLDQPPLAYVLKFRSQANEMLPLLRELFPDCRCLFMYRSDVVAMANSMYRLSHALPCARIMYALNNQSRYAMQIFVRLFSFKPSGHDVGPLCTGNNLEIGIMWMALQCAVFRTLYQQGHEIRTLRFEDLVGRPLDTCRAIMELFGLPLSLAESGVKGLELDSQRNSPLARSNIGHVPNVEMTPKEERSLKMILEACDLPPFGEELILQGDLFGQAPRYLQ